MSVLGSFHILWQIMQEFQEEGDKTGKTPNPQPHTPGHYDHDGILLLVLEPKRTLVPPRRVGGAVLKVS